MPVDLWDIVIESISNLSENIGICCFGSVDDKDDAKILELHAKKHGVKFNDFTGLLKLDETATVLAAMNLFIGNDSGLGHIAEALGTSSFIFLGLRSKILVLYLGAVEVEHFPQILDVVLVQSTENQSVDIMIIYVSRKLTFQNLNKSS